MDSFSHPPTHACVLGHWMGVTSFLQQPPSSQHGCAKNHKDELFPQRFYHRSLGEAEKMRPPTQPQALSKGGRVSRELKSLGRSLLGRLACFLIPLVPTPSPRTFPVAAPQGCPLEPGSLAVCLECPFISSSRLPFPGSQGWQSGNLSPRLREARGLALGGGLAGIGTLPCPCSSQPLGSGVLRLNPVPSALNYCSSLLTPKFKLVALSSAP